MMNFLLLLVHVLVSPFKTQARLDEIVLLRHQLSVLRQRVPSKPRLTVVDRLLFVWQPPPAPAAIPCEYRLQSRHSMLTKSTNVPLLSRLIRRE